MAKPAFTTDQAHEILIEFIDGEVTVTALAAAHGVNRETIHKLVHGKSYPEAHEHLDPIQVKALHDRLLDSQRGRIDHRTAGHVWRLYADNPDLGKDLIAAKVGISPSTVHDIITGEHHSKVRQAADDSEQRRVRRKRTRQTSGADLIDNEAVELLVRFGRGEFETLDAFCTALGISATTFRLILLGRYIKGPVGRAWQLIDNRERHAAIAVWSSLGEENTRRRLRAEG